MGKSRFKFWVACAMVAAGFLGYIWFAGGIDAIRGSFAMLGTTLSEALGASPASAPQEISLDQNNSTPNSSIDENTGGAGANDYIRPPAPIVRKRKTAQNPNQPLVPIPVSSSLSSPAPIQPQPTEPASSSPSAPILTSVPPIQTPTPTSTPAPTPSPAPTSTPIFAPPQAPPAPPNVALDHLLITNIQLAGTARTNSYVKIVNPTARALDIGDWKLRKKSSTGKEYSIKTFPKGSVIATRGYFTWANSKADFAQSISADVASTEVLSANNSVALFDASGTMIDAVAWGTGTDQYSEGATYPDNPEASQVLTRKSSGGAFIDTENNASDFMLQ